MHTCTAQYCSVSLGSVSLNVVNSIVYFINRNEKKKKIHGNVGFNGRGAQTFGGAA